MPPTARRLVPQRRGCAAIREGSQGRGRAAVSGAVAAVFRLGCTMTLAEAQALLDAVRDGADAPAELVKAALQATGDLPTLDEYEMVARTHVACAGFVPIAR